MTMPDLLPAGTLRHAAALMRERAALVPPPPWYSAVHDVTTFDGLNVIASSGLTVRAEYVASWHPAVALAVADWLDCAAALIEATVFPHDDDAIAKYPLAVARSYLGEDAGTP